jgi:MraZ protein
MFSGEYNHSIDGKGRVIVPSKFREQLGETFVVTKGLDGCVFAYPKSEWEGIEEKFRGLPSNAETRRFMRFFFAGAATLDKQGRILLPQNLREHADLQKDIVSAGVLNRVEIWNRDRWLANSNYEDMDEVAEHMAELGFSF